MNNTDGQMWGTHHSQPPALLGVRMRQPSCFVFCVRIVTLSLLNA